MLEEFKKKGARIAAVNYCAFNAANRHSLGIVYEHFLNALSVDGQISWVNKINPSQSIALIHEVDSIKETLENYSSSNEYTDVHHWVFTKTSFELLIADLVFLGYLTNMRIVKSFDTVGNEFFVSFMKTDNNDMHSFNSTKRILLLHQIERELRFTNVFLSRKMPGSFINEVTNQNVQYHIDSVYRDNEGIFVEGWAVCKSFNANDTEVYICLAKTKVSGSFLFSTLKKERIDVAEFLSNEIYVNSGFMGCIPSEYVRKYDISDNDIKIFVKR